MHTIEEKGDTKELSRWIRNELNLPDVMSRGRRGKSVKRIQEWLGLQGYGVHIDGAYGPVTERSITRFQEDNDLSVNGETNDETYYLLTAPMRRAVTSTADQSISFGSSILDWANQHLIEHPREIGGVNCGPWVRLYMKGHEGTRWYWCAGFVSFIVKQAAETLDISPDFRGTFSCDLLASRAKEKGNFVSEKDAQYEEIEPGSIFIKRRSRSDWTHTGIVTDFGIDYFDTVEGNTNQKKHRNGVEVAALSRGYTNMDFITTTT